MYPDMNNKCPYAMSSMKNSFTAYLAFIILFVDNIAMPCSIKRTDKNVRVGVLSRKGLKEMPSYSLPFG